jgi:uncharacterized protein DUF4197
MIRFQTLILSIVMCSVSCIAQSPLDRIWQSVNKPQSNANLSTDTITAGLKEALKVSTTQAVAKTGKPDGFLGNPAIRIPLPTNLQKARTGLQLVGMGPQMDQLEVGMNRAAEQATPLAKQIFLNALMKMTITDARNILNGGDTAATQYFKSTTSEELTTAFAPIVHKAMQNVGVVRQYDQLMQNSMAGPLLQSRGVNLDQYVVGKTLDGLFYMLGQEETQIRKNPAAQTTAILRQVFGRQKP